MKESTKLRHDRDIELSKRIESGDDSARWELVMDNQFLIRWIVSPIARRFNQDVDDMTNEALIFAYMQTKYYKSTSILSFVGYIKRSLIGHMSYVIKNETYAFYVARNTSYLLKCRKNDNMKYKFRYSDLSATRAEQTMNGMHRYDIHPHMKIDTSTNKKIDNKNRIDFLLDFLSEKKRSYIIRFFGLDGRVPMCGAEIAREDGVHHSYVNRQIKSSINEMRAIGNAFI